MNEEHKTDIQYKLEEKIEPAFSKKPGEKPSILERLTTPGFIAGVVFLYVSILFILLLSELGFIPVLSEVRVTNQVVILFSLIFLPFFIISSSRLVHTISLRLSGQEIRIEMAQIKQKTDENLERVEKDASRNVSTAEQALWPMLAGNNPEAEERWENKKIIIGENMSDKESFEENQKKVKNLKVRPKNEELLELYALYKQATAGDVTGKRPGMLNLKERAKFDSWANKSGVTSDSAMQAYNQLVAKLIGEYGVD